MKQLQLTVLFVSLASYTLAAGDGTVIPLKFSSYGQWYSAELTFGNQSLSVLADTGSADLWVLGEDWECVTENLAPLPRSKCPFNESYFKSSAFKPIKAAYLGEFYGQGSIIGALGYENVQLGSLRMPQQEMGFVSSTTNGVDASISGLMGLAFPVLDQRMLGMGITYFSLALERTPFNQESGFGGYLSIGTVPPVPHGDFVTVPVEVTKDVPLLLSNGTKQVTYWTLTVDAVVWDKDSNTQPFQAVVDSGNAINFVPEAIAIKFNAAFDPPGELDPGSGVWTIKCDATPPAGLGLRIGGRVFEIDKKDMIPRDSSGNCFSSLSASPPAFGANGTKIAILGDAFLKNVVAVFDYDQKEMRFAPRQTNWAGPSLAPGTGGAAARLSSDGIRFLSAALALMFLVVSA